MVTTALKKEERSCHTAQVFICFERNMCRKSAMMNYVWAAMIILSFICAVYNGNIPELSQAVAASAAKAAELVIKVTGMLCLWGGIMEIANDSGLTAVVGKIMSPLLKIIFPKIRKDSDALKYISMNISANLLGLSNAATPLGLKAMHCLYGECDDTSRASADMIVFVVMNSAAMRLIPTTAATLRQQAGSTAPMEIMPATVLTSLCALTAAISAARLGNFIYERRHRRD